MTQIIKELTDKFLLNHSLLKEAFIKNISFERSSNEFNFKNGAKLKVKEIKSKFENKSEKFYHFFYIDQPFINLNDQNNNFQYDLKSREHVVLSSWFLDNNSSNILKIIQNHISKNYIYKFFILIDQYFIQHNLYEVWEDLEGKYDLYFEIYLDLDISKNSPNSLYRSALIELNKVDLLIHFDYIIKIMEKIIYDNSLFCFNPEYKNFKNSVQIISTTKKINLYSIKSCLVENGRPTHHQIIEIQSIFGE